MTHGHFGGNFATLVLNNAVFRLVVPVVPVDKRDQSGTSRSIRFPLLVQFTIPTTPATVNTIDINC
jgi:hypothetical protein